MSEDTNVPAGHVRVRIAVAVGPDGDWVAYGSRHTSDMTKKTEVKLTSRDALYWVDVDLAIPSGPLIATPRVVREQ